MLQHDNKAIWVIIFVFAIFLVVNFIFTQYEILQLKNSFVPQAQSTSQPLNMQNTDQCGSACQAYIRSVLTQGSAVPSPTASSVPTSKPVAVATTKTTQITYIPLSGGSTQSTGWADVAGTQFTLNIGDYGTNPYAIWDANLRVDNANGTTYARLYDTTHGISVNGSEISVSNTSTSTDVTSSALQFWNGNNTYVVQIKSLNNQAAFIDSGRIKISY